MNQRDERVFRMKNDFKKEEKNVRLKWFEMDPEIGFTI